MSLPRPVHDRGSLGLATSDRDALRKRAGAAWDDFLTVASDCDLSAPCRLGGMTGRDLLIHLGSWGGSTIDAILANAHAGGGGPLPDPGRDNPAAIAEHRDASDAEVLAAVTRSRDAVAAFLGSADDDAWGLAPAQAMVGPLPVITIVHAASYELAVHALDLAPCGAPHPPPALLDTAVGSLVDVTGALAARTGRRAAVTVRTPTGSWRGEVRDPAGGWSTCRLAEAEAVRGASVSGTATDVLDASAGRVVIPQLLANRRIRLHDIPGLLQLAPIAVEVPGIPGGPALRVASRMLAGVGGVLGRIPRVPGLH